MTNSHAVNRLPHYLIKRVQIDYIMSTLWTFAKLHRDQSDKRRKLLKRYSSEGRGYALDRFLELKQILKNSPQPNQETSAGTCSGKTEAGIVTKEKISIDCKNEGGLTQKEITEESKTNESDQLDQETRASSGKSETDIVAKEQISVDCNNEGGSTQKEITEESKNGEYNHLDQETCASTGKSKTDIVTKEKKSVDFKNEGDSAQKEISEEKFKTGAVRCSSDKTTYSTKKVMCSKEQDLKEYQKRIEQQNDAVKKIHEAREEVYADQIRNVWGRYKYGLTHVLSLNDLKNAPDAIM